LIFVVWASMLLFHKSVVSNKQLAIVERFNEIIFIPSPNSY